MASTVALRRTAGFSPLVAATLLMALLSTALVLVTVTASLAGAQETQQTTTSVAGTDGPSSAGNILPRPNSGQAPDSANDPGGWQQYMVFALIGLGLLVIVALATRDSRRIRRAQGRYPS